MIKIHDISVQLNRKKILQHINLDIEPGEVVAVVGANGAGKSTLLKVVAGDITVQKGSVSINNQLLSDWTSKELAGVRGVLSQNVQLSFALTVLETVLLGRFPFYQKESSAQSRKVAYWALQQVNLEGFEQRNMLTLSGGEQQRVHFARILTQLYEPHANPKYLLLDEPIASLDVAQQHSLLALSQHLAHIKQYGVLIILHDINLAAQYADRIVLLKAGHIVAVGKPEVVLTTENIEEVFDIQSVVTRHPVYNCPLVTTYAL